MPKFVGQRIKRTEDPRLIKGLAHYVDDVRLPDTLHVAFVRSLYAHARITADTSAAVKAPGVIAVYTAKDTANVGPVPCAAARIWHSCRRLEGPRDLRCLRKTFEIRRLLHHGARIGACTLWTSRFFRRTGQPGARDAS